VNAGRRSHALQLRQAKLSFPSVHLMVGVFSDTICSLSGPPTRTPHVERCEVVRHCRWADEVIPDAPWMVDEAFVLERRIDYVGVEVGASVDPSYDKLRIHGYDAMKRLGKHLTPLSMHRPIHPER
jgi:choline-phosphate cytidylyltransferase